AFEAASGRERPAAAPGTSIVRVLKPGAFTTIQGGPRHGLGALGVGASGAMDLASLALANEIAGNGPFSGALEVTIAGPLLELLMDATFALAGAPVEARLDGSLL